MNSTMTERLKQNPAVTRNARGVIREKTPEETVRLVQLMQQTFEHHGWNFRLRIRLGARPYGAALTSPSGDVRMLDPWQDTTDAAIAAARAAIERFNAPMRAAVDTVVINGQTIERTADDLAALDRQGDVYEAEHRPPRHDLDEMA